MSEQFEDFNIPKRLVDEFNNVHLIGSVLGQGGQGVVFRTRDADIALKLVTDEDQNPLTDPAKIRHYQAKYRNLRKLPVPRDLHICKPVARLQTHAGYVMLLLNSMKPVDDLWPHPRYAHEVLVKDIPEWLSSMASTKLREAQKLTYYAQTGGLRLRLLVLAEAARIIAQLHASGMVYGDINRENIFYSDVDGQIEVWLIDADNLVFEDKESRTVVYTPSFGAPELIRGDSGIMFRTDVFAFANLAYRMLSLNHPFEGKALDAGGWDDEGEDDLDPTDKAHLGLYPFIDHPDDDSNAAEAGLPSELLCTQAMQKLFQKTFVTGLHQPYYRPTMLHWVQALREAADQCIECSQCGMGYYLKLHNNKTLSACPYCQHQPQTFLKFEKFYRTSEGLLDPSPISTLMLSFDQGQNYHIPAHLFELSSWVKSQAYPLQVFNKDGVLLVKPDTLQQQLYYAQSNDDQFMPLHLQLTLDLNPDRAETWFSVPHHLNLFTRMTLISGVDHEA